MYRFWKRFFDIVLSVLLIILFSPIFLIFIILVSVTSKGGPFFVAPRGGKNGKPFNIIKFRSMKINSEGNGTWNVSDKDKRITKIGHFLRKTKVDELPQLFNVFLGQMSFVGPRPELIYYINLYSQAEKPILDNKPGITDWASIVNSKQFIDFTAANDPDECYFHDIRPLKLKLQLYYRNHYSLLMDIKIMFWTLVCVLFRKNKYPKDIQKILEEYQIEKKECRSFREKMEYVTLGDSNLRVSRLCFGGCPMGEYGWGETNTSDFIYAIRYAIDSGINFFDTADVYGLGKSEETLGDAIKGRRKEVVIATKFGCRRKDGKTYYDNSPEWIREALSQSLARLKTDYIDLYQIHYLDYKTPLNIVVKTLEELVTEGKIRFYGISNISGKDIDDIKKSKGHFVSFQDEYSLATRKNEQNILMCSSELKATPMTWGSLGQGILTGAITKETIFGPDDRRSRPEYVNFHGEKFVHNLKIVDELKRLSNLYKKSIPAIAVRFTYDYIPGSVTLVGIKSVKELKSNLEVMGWQLKKEDIENLDKISYWKPEMGGGAL